MTKHVVISALAGALMVVATGCSDECVDQFDCLNDKGTPAEGREWVCVDNKCEERETQPPSGEDAGTETDAGTEMDAGTETDAGTDAGTMTVGKGGVCTASAECMAGLRCEGAEGARTCQPLHIAVTASLNSGAGPIEAVAVLAESGAPTFNLSEAAGPSRFPRWSTNGTAVAFVEEETAGAPALVSRSIPPAAGVKTPLTTAGTAGTEDFRHLEWEPSSSVTWVKKAGTSISGIYAISGEGGGTVEELSPNGGFPSWKNAQTFAYSAKGLGLQTRTIGGSSQAVSGGETGEQPKYNRVNDFLLYLASTQSDTFSGGEQQSLYELFTLPASGPTSPASPIARLSTPTPATAGEVKSFITAHNWAPDGTYVTYVRVFYFDPTDTALPAIICGNPGAEACGDQAGPNVYLQRTNPENGQAVGDPILVASNATLPAVSPDGYFVAYVQGQRLYVKRINPTDWSLGEAIVLTPDTMRVQTNLGDDHRPRWQPR